MQTNQILSAPLIDIIFDGRNKAYGAYELRKTYEKRVRKALLITGLIALFSFGSVVLASTMKNEHRNFRIDEGIMLTEIDEVKPPEKLPEPERPDVQEPPVETERFTEPEIVEQPESPPPSNEDLADAKIDIDPKEGKVYEGEVDPGPEKVDDGGKGVVEDKSTKETGPAETVDIDAKFDGNWKRFLESNLNAEVPVDNNAPAGRYSVVIRFVVDIDGSISDITALTAHGYGLEEEAIRVIRKSKKWQPAFLNGVHLKAYKKQVVVFEVME